MVCDVLMDSIGFNDTITIYHKKKPLFRYFMNFPMLLFYYFNSYITDIFKLCNSHNL